MKTVGKKEMSLALKMLHKEAGRRKAFKKFQKELNKIDFDPELHRSNSVIFYKIVYSITKRRKAYE